MTLTQTVTWLVMWGSYVSILIDFDTLIIDLTKKCKCSQGEGGGFRYCKG